MSFNDKDKDYFFGLLETIVKLLYFEVDAKFTMNPEKSTILRKQIQEHLIRLGIIEE